ncbi:MAG: hypothetical protein E7051_03715 [Lentisphaerae bacterium]|nr:hypothetical protein [Lentisphaerota bacterium]
MKKSTFIAICALCCSTILSLSAASSKLKPAVNIGNIVNKSGVNLDTNTFVTRLSTAIVNTRQFDVIESERIDEIVAEWNKANAGLTKGSTNAEDQTIAEVGYKLVPTITGYEENATAVTVGGAQFLKVVSKLSLNVRFLRLSDGKIAAAKEVVGEVSIKLSVAPGIEQAKGGTLAYQDCVKDAAQKVVDALMDLCYPIEAMEDEDDDEVTIKVQSERVKEGDFFKVYRVKGEVEREIATIKVTDVRPTQSTCEVISHKGKRTIKEGDICRPTKPVKQKRASTAFDDL